MTTNPKTGVNAFDVMKDFYEMKKQYEEKYYQKYVQSVVKDQSKSARERRLEFSKLPRPECISCNRNVGTIFSVKHHDEEPFRIFVAKCGDLKDPCALNIHFQVSDRLTYEVAIRDTVENLEEIKKKIIQEKNEIMFGYKYKGENDGKQKMMYDFNIYTEDLKEKTEMAGFFIESNMLKNDNPERTNLLSKLEDEFGKELLLPFKKSIEDYMKTNNNQIITKAVESYNTEMVPKLKDIQQLKYDVNYVDFDPVTENYFLVQRKNSLESLEFGTTTNDIVHAFIKGGPASKQKKARTLKKAGEETLKRKTRKLKPKLIVEEEPEEEKVEEPKRAEELEKEAEEQQQEAEE